MLVHPSTPQHAPQQLWRASSEHRAGTHRWGVFPLERTYEVLQAARVDDERDAGFSL